MEQIKNIRESLGINQVKMAALIGVSRSHLAMYESGKRELPAKALVTLSELSRYILERDNGSAKNVQDKKYRDELQKYLERQIIQAKYTLAVLEKKIVEASKKIDSATSALQLAGFQEARTQKGNALPTPPLKLLTGEAATKRGTESLKLYKYSLRKEIVAFELGLLEQEIKISFQRSAVSD